MKTKSSITGTLRGSQFKRATGYLLSAFLLVAATTVAMAQSVSFTNGKIVVSGGDSRTKQVQIWDKDLKNNQRDLTAPFAFYNIYGTGNQLIQVILYDGSGKELTRKMVNVNLGSNPPTPVVSLISGKIVVKGDSTVKQVEIWNKDWNKYQKGTTAPFEFSNLYGSGSQQLQVRLLDGSGNQLTHMSPTVNLGGSSIGGGGSKYGNPKVGDKFLGMPGMIVQEKWSGTKLRNPVRTFTGRIQATNQ